MENWRYRLVTWIPNDQYKKNLLEPYNKAPEAHKAHITKAQNAPSFPSLKPSAERFTLLGP